MGNEFSLSKPQRLSRKALGKKTWAALISFIAAVAVEILADIIPRPQRHSVFLGLVLLGVTIGSGDFLLQWLRYYLAKIEKYDVLLANYSQCQIKEQAFEELEANLPGFQEASYKTGITDTMVCLRSQALASTLSHNVEILEIRNIEGTVHLILNVGTSQGLRTGMRFDVRTKHTEERWGAVEISMINDSKAYAKPVDRIKPAFWRELEGRMDHDPSPPPGVTVGPYGPSEVIELIRQVLEPRRNAKNG